MDTLEAPTLIPRLITVAELGHAALNVDDLGSFPLMAAQSMVDVLGVDVSGVLQLDAGGESLVVRAAAGVDASVIGRQVPVGVEFLSGYTLTMGRTIVLENAAEETRFRLSPLMEEMGAVSGMCVPLMDGSRPYGIMCALSRQPRTYSDADVAYLDAIGHVMSSLLRRFRDGEEIARRAREYMTLAETAPDHIGRLNPDLRFLYVNRALEALIGMPREQLLGKSIAETGHPPALVEAWSRHARGVFETGKTTDLIFSYPSKSGPRFYQGRVVPEPGPTGTIDSMLFFARDITDLHQKEEALRRSEARLEAVIGSTMDAIVALDTECRIVVFNAAAETVFDCSAREALGKRFARFLPYPSLLALKKAAGHLKRLDPETEASVRLPGELVLARSSGVEFPAEVTLSRARTSDQILFTFVIRDISERHAAARALTEKDEQLVQAQKMEAIGRLAGGIAHDFNNILSVIQGYGGLLRDRFGTEGPEGQDVAQILAATQRGAELTRRLLAFGRRQTMRPRTVDLNQVLGGMEVLMKHVLGSDITLHLRLMPELGAVRVDPVQVEQVLMNLVVNAKDAMGNGGEVVVETGNTELDEEYARGNEEVTPGRYVLVAISDTGCGMDAATRARIFEPFFTTKSDSGGTGLGLSTVHGIVKQSGGHVTAHSEPGRGTTFRIYLPLVDGRAETVGAPPSFPVAEADVRESVLLVEDEEAVRQAVQHMLEGRGYRVFPVAGMSPALRFSREYRGPVDVLVTDVAMPGGTGPELADVLRNERPDIHVLFMSGYAQSSPSLKKMMEKGFPLLEKPFTAEHLHSEIRRLVETRA